MGYTQFMKSKKSLLLLVSASALLFSCNEENPSTSASSEGKASTTTSSQTVSSSPSIAKTFAITYEAQNDIFALTPIGNVDLAKVEAGSNVSFSLTFTAAYSQKRNLVVNANGTSLEEKDSVYTLNNIQEDVALQIAVDKNQYAVTYNHDDNANLLFQSINDAALPETILYGESLSFRVAGAGEYSQELNLAVTANAKALTAVDGIYTLDNIQEDLLLHVTCDLNEYSVTVVTKDENGEHSETNSYHKGDAVHLDRPSDYQKDGKTYTFTGYKDSQGNDVTTYTVTGNEGENFQITAQYKATVGLVLPKENDAYTLLDQDGKALTMGSTITIEGESISNFVFQIEAKIGYSQYRNLAVNAGDLAITLLDESTHRYSIAVTASAVLSVQMDINQYQVTMENTTIDGTSVSTTALHGALPATPSLDGYLFDHWTDASGNDVTAITSDTTLIAYWKKGIMTAQSEAREALGRDALLATKGTDFNESGAPEVKAAAAPGAEDSPNYAITLHVDNACLGKNHLITLPAFDFSAYPEITFSFGSKSWGTRFYLGSIDTMNSIFKDEWGDSIQFTGGADQQGTITIKNGYLIGIYNSKTAYQRLSASVYRGKEGLSIIAQGESKWTFYYGIGAFQSAYQSADTDYRAEAAKLLANIPADSTDSNAKDALLAYSEYVTTHFTAYEKANYAHSGNAATVEQALYGGKISAFGYHHDNFPALTMHGDDVDGNYSSATLKDKRVARLMANEDGGTTYPATQYPLELKLNYNAMGGYVITFPLMDFSQFDEANLTIAMDSNCWGTNYFLGDSTDDNDDIFWQQKTTSNKAVHLRVKDTKLIPGDGESARNESQYQSISNDIYTGKAPLQITLRMGGSTSSYVGNFYFSHWIGIKK